MLVHNWSTAHLPAARQFDFVRDLLLDTAVPIRLERGGRDRCAPFRAASEMHLFADGVGMIYSRGQAATGTRGGAEIARGAPDCFWLLQYRHSAGVMTLDDRDYRVEPGDIVYGDCGVRQFGDGAEHVEFGMWMLPAALVGPLLATTQGDPRGLIRRATPFGRLATDYLSNLAGALDQAGEGSAPALIGHLATLVALHRGLSPHLDEVGRNAVDDVRLIAIRRDIARRFADPSLTPAGLAARHGMALRTLHALFEPTGVSCARYLLGVRLDAAHAMLRQPDARTPSMTQIAYACGFDSLSTFYRNFRARYGCSPRDLL